MLRRYLSSSQKRERNASRQKKGRKLCRTETSFFFFLATLKHIKFNIFTAWYWSITVKNPSGPPWLWQSFFFWWTKKFSWDYVPSFLPNSFQWNCSCTSQDSEESRWSSLHILSWIIYNTHSEEEEKRQDRKWLKSSKNLSRRVFSEQNVILFIYVESSSLEPSTEPITISNFTEKMKIKSRVSFSFLSLFLCSSRLLLSLLPSLTDAFVERRRALQHKIQSCIQLWSLPVRVELAWCWLSNCRRRWYFLSTWLIRWNSREKLYKIESERTTQSLFW